MLILASVHTAQMQTREMAVGPAVVHARILPSGVFVESQLIQVLSSVQQILRRRKRLRRQRAHIGQTIQEPVLRARICGHASHLLKPLPRKGRIVVVRKTAHDCAEVRCGFRPTPTILVQTPEPIDRAGAR